MHIGQFFRKFPRPGQVFIFTGGTQPMREYLLYETLASIHHAPEDRTFLSTTDVDEVRQALMLPPQRDRRVVAVWEFPDIDHLRGCEKLLQKSTNCLLVTSPRLRYNMHGDFTDWARENGAIVRLGMTYDMTAVKLILRSRYALMSTDVCQAIVDRSPNLPTALNNARMVMFFSKQTPELVALVVGGARHDAHDFAEALFNREFSRLATMHVDGAEAMAAVFSKALELYKLLAMRTRGFSEWDAMEQLRVPRFHRKTLANTAHLWSLPELVSLLNELVVLSLRERQGCAGILEYLCVWGVR
jgi:hypothetical protein